MRRCCMKKKTNMLTIIGLLIYIASLLINKFIVKIPYEIMIPIAIFGIALVVIGTIKTNRR